MHYNKEESIRRIDILERFDDICKWVQEGKPLIFMQKELRCNYETLNKVLYHFNIDYHGIKTEKGFNNRHNNGKISVYEYLGTDRAIKSSALKQKLFEEGIKEYKCEQCGNNIWLGSKIPLELHHINGNPHDNRLENLQILCPNCHALTDNFKNKNIKRTKKIKHKSEYKEHLDSLKIKRLQLLYENNIDFSKFGWVTDVAKLFNVKPQVASRYIRKHFPNFYNQCYRSVNMKKQ